MESLLTDHTTPRTGADYRRRLAAALVNRGMDSSPVQHWTQGAARIAQALVGGTAMGNLDAQEEAAQKVDTELRGGLVNPGGTAPGTPSAGGAVTPQIAAALTSPSASPGTRSIAMAMLRPRLEAEKPKDPQFGVISQNQYGEPVHGWIDPRTRTTTPAGGSSALPPAGSAPGSGADIPPPPPGVDPKVWRAKHTERAADNALGGGSDQAGKLRGEIRSLPSFKNLSEVAPRFTSMVEAAGRDNRASDLSLVYGLMKILDPTSVVRESEADMAQNIATLPQKYRSQVQSFLTGQGRLAPEVREAILVEAQGAAGSYRGAYDRDMDQYRGIAQRGKINEADVIPSFAPFPMLKPSKDQTRAPTLEQIEAEIQRRRNTK